jgi:hypothetical protein
MYRISKISFYFIVCAVVLFSFHCAASACQVDEFYFTKEGHLAASTPGNLSEAINYQEKGNQEKLAYMMKSGTVVRLKEKIKVQALERSVEQRILKIKFSDNDTPYWVREGSLKQIKCN